MRLLKVLPLMSVIALGGCIDEYEQCLRNNSKDIRVVDQLIVETQATLARGYGFETVIEMVTEEQPCLDINQEPTICLVEVPVTKQVPVAIDLDAERRKLEQLLDQKQALQARYAQAQQICREKYPPES